VRIDSVCKKWAGSLQIGLTAVSPSPGHDTTVPATLSQLSPDATWFVTRSEVWHNGKKIRENYCPSLDRVDVDDVVGVRRSAAGAMHLCVNGHDMGVAATDIVQVCFEFITADKGEGTCFCPCLFVCLSVARLLKNVCMDFDEMLRVDGSRDMDELINFWARSGS